MMIPAKVQCFLDAGDFSRAEALLEEWVKEYPNDCHARQELARVRIGLGQFSRARAELEALLNFIQGRGQTHHLLGCCFEAEGNLDKAMLHAVQAIREDRAETRFWRFLVRLTRQSKSFPELEQVLKEAAAGAGDPSEFYVELGEIYADKKDERLAIIQFELALFYEPRNFRAHIRLAEQALRRRLFDEMEWHADQASMADPASGWAMTLLGLARMEQGEINQALNAWERAIALEPGNAEPAARLLMLGPYSPEMTGDRMARYHDFWNRTHGIRPQNPGKTVERHGKRRLRIAYISPDFRDHPVGRFIFPLLKAHDRDTVEIVAVSTLEVGDHLNQSIRQAVERYEPLGACPAETMVDRLRSLEADMIIDLAMHGPRSCLKTLSARVAPVQACYLAYCGTTGLPALDFRITDKYLDPPGLNRPWYSEKPLYLNASYWCYQPDEHGRNAQVQPPPCLDLDRVTFGCLNHPAKINRLCARIWGRLIEKLPGSRLLLHAYPGKSRRRLIDLFSGVGIGPERIEFADRMAPPAYFESYGRIDIALDPMPYNGGTTTCDALWMGVPVLTLPGEPTMSRAGLSILSNAGLEKYAAKDENHFVEIGLGLASDWMALARTRRSLRHELAKQPLMDPKSCARDLERLYFMACGERGF